MQQCDKAKHSYFAAGNSFKGFISYFEEIFFSEDIWHLYIIKGGPGTGKSRFMTDIADTACKLGCFVEYYYCSSDQSSLDGIIIYGVYDSDLIPRTIAVIDGTAPHCYDMKHPGVREDIINLGAFWDIDTLAHDRDEISRIMNLKNNTYKDAIDYLSAYHGISLIVDKTVNNNFKYDKAQSYAKKLISEFGAIKKRRVVPALTDSVGILGNIRFDTYAIFAENVLTINDIYGCSFILFDLIMKEGLERGLAMRISYDPIEPYKINGLLINEGEFAVVKGSEGDREALDEDNFTGINMRRFIRLSDIKPERGFLKKYVDIRSSALQCALKKFEISGMYHFELEEYYIGAMDFAKKEEFTREFCEKIFAHRNI